MLNQNLSNVLFYRTKDRGRNGLRIARNVGALDSARLEDNNSQNRSQWSTDTASSRDKLI